MLATTIFAANSDNHIMVHIHSSKSSYKLGDKISIDVSLTNVSSEKLQLYSFFDPILFHFEVVVKKKAEPEDILSKFGRKIRPAVSPTNEPTNWQYISPGVSVSKTLDITEDIKESGKYEVVVDFHAPIIILTDEGGKRYSEQKSAISNIIEFSVYIE
jgi:hypothetical protein